MTKYNVIAKDARTGAERVLDTITAKNQVDAKKQAIKAYFSKINMVMEQLMVVRAN